MEPLEPKTKQKFPFIGLVVILILISIALVMQWRLSQVSSELSAIKTAMAEQKTESESAEEQFDVSKWTAIFMTGGEVYFGKVRENNQNFIKLTDIYYLRSEEDLQNINSTDANQDISLAKLGCELHGPDDAMFIYKDTINFWETLSEQGQVVKAINEFLKVNPSGQQQCAH